jgi:hypothetical protein
MLLHDGGRSARKGQLASKLGDGRRIVTGVANLFNCVISFCLRASASEGRCLD